jgi:hypothetical protein
MVYTSKDLPELHGIERRASMLGIPEANLLRMEAGVLQHPTAVLLAALELLGVSPQWGFTLAFQINDACRLATAAASSPLKTFNFPQSKLAEHKRLEEAMTASSKHYFRPYSR